MHVNIKKKKRPHAWQSDIGIEGPHSVYNLFLARKPLQPTTEDGNKVTQKRR